MLLDDLPEKIVPRGGGDEGAYRPHHPQLQPAVRVEGIRDAAVVAVPFFFLVAGGGGAACGGMVEVGAAEDDAAMEGAAELGAPPEEDAVVGGDVAGGELDEEVPHVGEAAEDLGGGVLSQLREEGLEAEVGGPEAVERLEDGEDDELQDMGEEVARFQSGGKGGGGRGRGGGAEGLFAVAVDGDHPVDLDVEVLDEGNEGVEAPAHSSAPAEGADVGELIKDDEDDGIGDSVELIGEEERIGVDAGGHARRSCREL